jgi:uncharacterized membrane protein
VAAGELQVRHSPIVAAITEAESGTTGEIRVHLSRHWMEPDAFARASHLFAKFGMQATQHRNGVLLYVNLRRRKLAVVGDQAIHTHVGQPFWELLIQRLQKDLRATHYENAISNTVRQIGEELTRHFPAGPGGHANNELPNIVTED